MIQKPVKLGTTAVIQNLVWPDKETGMPNEMAMTHLAHLAGVVAPDEPTPAKAFQKAIAEKTRFFIKFKSDGKYENLKWIKKEITQDDKLEELEQKKKLMEEGADEDLF